MTLSSPSYSDHFEHNIDPMAPGVFISELLTDQFSDYLQTTITSYLYSLADSATARP